MTKPVRPWHLCDGAGATTSGHWRTRDDLAAAMRAAYGRQLPTWIGWPCDQPLIPHGYRHVARGEERPHR